MVPIDVFGVSDEASQLVYDLEKKGYETALEFKPKVDWPTEDAKPKDDRYIFACTVRPGNCGEWIVEVAPVPEVAIRNAINRLAIR